MPSFVNGVRAEFTVSDIEYSRDGGWFVTYRKAALLTILVMSLCLFSAYMGRQSSEQIVYVHKTDHENTSDEDKVISEIIFVAEDGVKLEIKTVEDPTVTKFTKLPLEVVPLHYDLHFMFGENLDHHTFKVLVNVTFQPLVDHLDQIVMHAKSLEFDDNIRMVMESQENRTIKVTLEEVDPRWETIKLKLDETISRHEKYKLLFHITGNIGHSTSDGGVLRQTFTEDRNQTLHMLFAKFDPTSARQAFPCFDEPSHKTTFNVTITHSKKYNCLFNTARKHNVTDSKNDALTVTTFETTPRMSTHTMSFFIGNISSQSVNVSLPHQKKSLPVNLWHRPHLTDHFVFVTELVREIVHFYHAMFDASLPLTKLDLVIVPQLNMSAAENWGLIYLAESDCKVDELDFEQKRILFILIGHNLAHHWLGDLVTFKNWTSVWFYESLAITSVDDALEKTDLSKVWPNSDMKFVQRKCLSLHSDSDYSTRSIKNKSEEAIQSADLYGSLGSLTYSKGVFILDMLRAAIPEDKYKEGVQSFIRTWDTENADEFDFTESLNSVLDKPLVWASHNSQRNLTHVLRNWVENEGFPVVHVTRDEKKRDTMKFRQERFLYDNPNDFDRDPDDQIWYIPITLTTLTNTNFSESARFWLDRSEYKYRVHGLEEDTWIIANLNFGGFFRVNYDLPNWSLLTKEIQRGSSSIFSPITQAQLMDDAFALARSGLLSYEIPLDMMRTVKDNSSYITWVTALNNVKYFKNVLIHEKHSMIEEFLRKLISSVYEHLSYEMTLSYREELLLSELTEWSCRLSIPACVRSVNKTYEENSYELIKDMYNEQTTTAILCTVVRENPDNWNTLWKSLHKGDKHYPILLRALSCSKNVTRVNEIFDKLLAEVSNPKLTSLWTQMSTDPDTSILLFNWFRANWDPQIKEKMKDHRMVVARIVAGCTQGLTTSVHLQQLKKFLQTHEDDEDLKDLEPVIKSSIQTIEAKISWRTKHSSFVNKWLRSYVENH